MASYVSLLSHTFAMLALRLFGVSYRARLWLSPVVFIIAIAVGLAVFAWRATNPETIVAAPWLSLFTVAALSSASNALSIMSFPVGFGERIR